MGLYLFPQRMRHTEAVPSLLVCTWTRTGSHRLALPDFPAPARSCPLRMQQCPLITSLSVTRSLAASEQSLQSCVALGNFHWQVHRVKINEFPHKRLGGRGGGEEGTQTYKPEPCCRIRAKVWPCLFSCKSRVNPGNFVILCSDALL